MIKWFFDKIDQWSKTGIAWPFIIDPVHKHPNPALLFVCITFSLAIVSVIALHFKLDIIIATLTSLMFWVVAMIFYVIGPLKKAKFDLDDKSVELENDDEQDKREDEKKP